MSVESIIWVGARKEVASVNPGSTTLVFSPSSECTPGNFLVITVMALTQAGAVTGISDSAGSLNFLTSAAGTVNRGCYILGCFISKRIKTSDTITVTFASSLGPCGYCAEEFYGISHAAVTDKSNNSSWTGSTAATTGTTATTTEAHELWTCCLGWDDPNSSISFPGGFNWQWYGGTFLSFGDGATFSGTTQYCIATATGAANQHGTVVASNGAGVVTSIKPIWTPPAGWVPSPAMAA